PAVATDSMSLNQCDVFVMLNPIEDWKSGMTKDELIEKMSKKLEQEVPGAASFGFMQPIEMRVNELIAGTRGDVAIKLFGDDLQVLADKGEEIERALAKITGA
ncbi:MAG TPA: efflux RND transporter permease subunit, partial [Pyrinomonadaceae bacterium]|nr:efflux RND transporter permease subunit [Pyrinomonadaceae bacterium]